MPYRKTSAFQVPEELRSAAIGGFLVIAVLFLSILTVGYYNYARMLQPDWPPALLVLLGFLVACGAFVLARATAAAKSSSSRHRTQGSERHAWILFFIILLSISALGTMNALFYLIEGDEVVAQRLQTSRDRVSALNDRGQRALEIPEIEQLKAAIKPPMSDLEQRILRGGAGQPLSCGVGPDARAAIVAVAGAGLTGFAFIPKTDREHDCKATEILGGYMQEYRKKADSLIAAKPAYVANHGDDRKKLSDELKTGTENIMKSLAEVAGDQATGSHGTITSLAAARTALGSAATAYGELAGRVKRLTGNQSIESEMDISDVVELGDMGHILKSLGKRLHDGQTYSFIVIALLLDTFMVWAFLVARRELGEQHHQSGMDQTLGDLEVQVHYLWSSARS
jgi:NADH:ubiquinone oxidoreductase subunit 6 (subunit J)